MTNHKKKFESNIGDIQRTLLARYDNRVELVSSTAVEGFVPYRPVDNEPRTVRAELLFPKPSQDRPPEKGSVYAYSCSEHPEHVKIGHTSRSVEERVARQNCFRDKKVLIAFEFAYPERIEQLVHRELGKYRYEILRCETCKVNHTEWFKVPVSEVIRVTTTWHTLVRMEPLYVGPRQLSAAWQARVSGMKGKLTAHKLLKAIKTEARRSKRTSMAAEQLSDTDDLAEQLRMLTVEVPENDHCNST